MALLVERHLYPAATLISALPSRNFLPLGDGRYDLPESRHSDTACGREFAVPSAADRQLIATIHMNFPAGFNWRLLNIPEHTAHHIVQ